MPAVSEGVYEDTRSRDNCSVSRIKSQQRAWPHPIIYCDEFQPSWYRSAHLVSFHVCDKFWPCLACRSISLKIPIPLLHTEPRLGLMNHSEGRSYSHIYSSPLQQLTSQWFPSLLWLLCRERLCRWYLQTFCSGKSFSTLFFSSWSDGQQLQRWHASAALKWPFSGCQQAKDVRNDCLLR